MTFPPLNSSFYNSFSGLDILLCGLRDTHHLTGCLLSPIMPLWWYWAHCLPYIGCSILLCGMEITWSSHEDEKKNELKSIEIKAATNNHFLLVVYSSNPIPESGLTLEVYACVHVCIYVCACMCVHVCMCVFICAHVYLCVYDMCMYMCVHVYI